MCNLGEGIADEAREEAQKRLIFKMFQAGLSLERIVEIVDGELSEAEVRSIEQELKMENEACEA